MRYAIVRSRDGSCCPAPAKLAPILQRIANECGCIYQSVYRGEDRGAARLLARCHKHNQRWIFDHYPPGVANPPGRSTHELRNDGQAYRGWRGMPLRWWQCGIDVDNRHVVAFIETARRHGLIATRTYPLSAVEYHHVNFRREPLWRRLRRRHR